MRILLLTPVHREKENTANKKRTLPIFQAQSSWLKALRSLGHKVSVFRYSDSVIMPNASRVYLKEFFESVSPRWRARFLRFKSKFYFLSLENFLKNKKLLALSESCRPDSVIISGGISVIFPSTIKKIKEKYQSKILLFSGVNPDVAVTCVEKICLKKGIIDVVVENDRGYAKKWERLGAKTIVLPISAVDPQLHKVIKPNNVSASDVSFVGTLTPDRQNKLARLLQFNIKIWGDIPPGVKLRKELEPYYYGKAFGKHMVNIFNSSKIVLNFQPLDMTSGGNMRTFEIPGCGAFQLADKIDPLFLSEGKDYVSFNDVEDLRNKIKYYLQNDTKRIKIAKSAFLKVHKEHTYEKHFEKLLSKI